MAKQEFKRLEDLFPISKDEFLLINSSLKEVELFLKSPLHGDYSRELDIQIDLLKNALFDPDLEFTGRHYDLFRGGIQKLLDAKDLFINMQAALEEETEN
jgi:hypothetical protein